MAPDIHSFGARFRLVVSFTCQPHYPQGESPHYPLKRRLGGPQNGSRKFVEDKSMLPLSVIELLLFGYRTRSLVSIRTMPQVHRLNNSAVPATKTISLRINQCHLEWVRKEKVIACV